VLRYSTDRSISYPVRLVSQRAGHPHDQSRGLFRGSVLFDGDRFDFLVGGEALKYLLYAVLHEGGHAFR
jgi:hypothetical protein